jgi:hypothetical protein
MSGAAFPSIMTFNTAGNPERSRVAPTHQRAWLGHASP